MRPESEVLKNHLHAALAHRHIVHRGAVDKDGSAIRSFQAGDQAEGGGLAAAALADDDEKLSGIDVEIGVVDCDHRAKLLCKPA